MKLRTITASVLLCLLACGAGADIIYLNTGGVVKGRIVESDDSEITVHTKHGQTTISRDDVDRIEACESVSALYYDKLEKLKQDDAQSHFTLAQWLKRINEPEFARDEFEKTIIIDPDHSGARAALDYIKKDNQWVRRDANPKKPRVVVNRTKKDEEPADEHNLLGAASDEVKKLIKKLDSAIESEREEALGKLAEVYRWGDVQAVGEYMRYREAQLITLLQQQEGDILNLLHGQLDEDLHERQARWFQRHKSASTMRERLHAWKTLDLLLKNELALLKQLTGEQAKKTLTRHASLVVLLGETQQWLKKKEEFTTEFGTCLTDVYYGILHARAGDGKRASERAKELESLEKYLIRTVLSWQMEEKSAGLTKEMLSLLNAFRENKGLARLRLHEVASKAAVGHARDMYIHEYFGHTSPTFGTPAYRLQRWYSIKVGWKTEEEGELISKRSYLPTGAFNEWLGKESARATILGKDWQSVGMGALGDCWVIILLRR